MYTSYMLDNNNSARFACMCVHVYVGMLVYEEQVGSEVVVSSF